MATSHIAATSVVMGVPLLAQDLVILTALVPALLAAAEWTARRSRYDLDMAKAVLSLDTAPEAEHLQVELWRAMSPLQKAQLTAAVTRGASDLALAGLRIRHPDASPRELEIRMAQMTLGADLVRLVYSDALEFLGP